MNGVLAPVNAYKTQRLESNLPGSLEYSVQILDALNIRLNQNDDLTTRRELCNEIIRYNGHSLFD